MRRHMPTPEQPEAHDSQLREALAGLEPERWRHALEEEGVTPTAEITSETRGGIACLLGQLGDSLTVLHAPVQRGLEQILEALAGKSFGSLEANQAVTRGVQDLLNRL